MENGRALACDDAANGGLRAQVDASQGDFQLVVNTLSNQSWELQRARERIHYGRRFRLLTEEDCLHPRPICDFERLHPEWDTTEYVLSTRVQPYVVTQATPPCSFCSDSHCSH